MAIWQYGFFVLPKEAWKKIGSIDIDPEWGFDDEVFWKYVPTSPTIFKEIADFLPVGNSWTEELTVYGNLESNVFEVLEEDNLVISVSFRIDFTTEYEHILTLIIHFLEQNGFIIISSVDLEEVDLNAFSVEMIIKNSRNYRIHHNLVEGNDPELDK